MIGADLTPFFSASEFARTATVGAESGLILFRAQDQEIIGGRAVSTEYDALMATDTFASLARGDVMTIGVDSFQVRQVFKVGDGATKRAILTKA